MMDYPAWHITTLLGRRAAVAHRHGRWSVVLDTCSAGAASLDDALCQALRADGSRSRAARSALAPPR